MNTPRSPRHLNRLLAALSKDDFAVISSHLTKVRLTQKTILQEPDIPITHVFFPLDCMISLVAVFETGEAVEIAAIGREGAVGTKIALSPPIALARAIVQLPGSALRMDIKPFLRAAQKNVAIMHMATCANEVVATNIQQSVGCNALHGLEARLARWLLHARDRYDHDELPLAHEFLSQMLGVRRSTVSLAAHTLQQAGVITYRRAKIRISDRAALEAISCECYRTVRRNVEVLTKFAHVPKQASEKR